MTRVKPNTISYVLPVFVFVFIALAGTRFEDSFLEELKKRYASHINNFPTERAYLMTDRFVYRPGEDMWFKGFVTSVNHKSYSEDLFIKLLNSNGEEVLNRRYPLFSNTASGRLNIPRSCIPGKYWLVAYSGWMKNRCPEEAFRKEILISKYYEKRFQSEVMYDKFYYYSGDTVDAHIRILDPSGKPIPETYFEYTVGSLKKSDIKESSKTDVKGKSRISFIVPEMDEMVVLNIEIRSRKFSGNYAHIVPSVYGRPVISFYPEGGNLVIGIKNVVGIKAVNKVGLPEIIRGNITDSKGKILAEVNTGSQGLGKFNFIPIQDTCFLEINFPIGITGKYPLPLAIEYGTTLNYIESDADSAFFSITSSDHRPQNSYWIAVLNNEILWTQTVRYSQNAVIGIPLKGLTSGILQVTIFDQHHREVAERLINIKPTRELTVKLEKHAFHPRQRVSLLIEYPDNLKNTELALSVSLGSLSKVNHSGLSSIINSPPCESNVIYTDDLAMLTSTSYSVNWQDIFSRTVPEDSFIRRDGLTGFVYDKKENVSPHAKVRVTHFPNFRFYETQSDENGRFQIAFGSDIIDFKFLNIDAYDALGKTSLNARVDYKYVEKLSQSLIKVTENSELQKISNLNRYGEPDLVYVLRYGPGKFRKSSSDNRKKYDPYQYAKYTDILDIIQDIQPYKLVNNRIVFTERRSKTDSTGMDESIIVINGVPKGNNINALQNILPSDITNINISNSLLDVHKYTPLNFNGVIEITTIQGMYRYRQQNFQVEPSIFSAERDFYSPDYAVESSYSPDNRKTLYWNPKITLYQGNSTLITFYTSDIKGTFYGNLVGIDINGNPVESEFSFRVE